MNGLFLESANVRVHRAAVGFTLLYFKIGVMLLVLETKMVDIGKIISLGNLLVGNPRG